MPVQGINWKLHVKLANFFLFDHQKKLDPSKGEVHVLPWNSSFQNSVSSVQVS